jgi:hypothetical protein
MVKIPKSNKVEAAYWTIPADRENPDALKTQVNPGTAGAWTVARNVSMNTRELRCGSLLTFDLHGSHNNTCDETEIRCLGVVSRGAYKPQ